MSECVVCMDMPESCAKCLAWSICPVLDEYMSAECYEWSFEDVLNMTDDEGFTKPEDCPIICSLPEGHGRLGDLDKLEGVVNMARIRVMRNGEDTNPYWECADLILQAPTIVPAEEERSET